MPRAAARTASITERIDRLKELRGEYRSVTPPLPRSAKIELTTRCNFHCFFCALDGEPGAATDMAWPLYTRLLREMRSSGVEQLGLFYIGESFACERLVEAVRYAKQDCAYPYVFLTTNGALAAAPLVRELMREGLDSLKFALNFAGGKQISRYAGVPAATFDAVVTNIRDACRVRDELVKETGRRCNIYASSLLYDDEQPRRMEPALSELSERVDQHYWLPLYGRAVPPTEDGTRNGDALNVSCKAVPCWSLFTEAHISVDGHLCACGLDHGKRFHLADLNECSFAQGWHAPAFQALRAAHLQGNLAGSVCQECIGYRRP